MKIELDIINDNLPANARLAEASIVSPVPASSTWHVYSPKSESPMFVIVNEVKSSGMLYLGPGCNPSPLKVHDISNSSSDSTVHMKVADPPETACVS